jgi:hypothetical protein
MSRISLLLMVLVVTRPAAAAVGVKAGASFACLRGGSIDEPYDAEPHYGPDLVNRSAAQTRVGAVFGATITTRIATDLEVHNEVLFVQKGAAFDGYTRSWFGGDTSWSTTTRLDYLELPVFLRLYQPLSVRVHLFLDAGIYVAALLDARTTAEVSSQSATEGLWNDIADGDLGGILGAGLEGRFRSRRCHLEFRYTPGLLAIQETGDTIKNTSITLAASMSL